MACHSCKKKRIEKLPELSDEERLLSFEKQHRSINTDRLKETYILLHKHNQLTPEEVETINKTFWDAFGEKWGNTNTQVRKLSHIVENVLKFKI